VYGSSGGCTVTCGLSEVGEYKFVGSGVPPDEEGLFWQRGRRDACVVSESVAGSVVGPVGDELQLLVSGSTRESDSALDLPLCVFTISEAGSPLLVSCSFGVASCAGAGDGESGFEGGLVGGGAGGEELASMLATSMLLIGG
jgi:hypothetical protein